MVLEDDFAVRGRADAPLDRLIDTEEAARILGVSVNTLCKARVYGGANAVPFVKLGRLVRYSTRTIANHVAANTFASTSDRCGY